MVFVSGIIKMAASGTGEGKRGGGRTEGMDTLILRCAPTCLITTPDYTVQQATLRTPTCFLPFLLPLLSFYCPAVATFFL